MAVEEKTTLYWTFVAPIYKRDKSLILQSILFDYRVITVGSGLCNR